jgi:membrane associated rhomboid family serine protease
MDDNSRPLWIRFGSGRPFKVSTAGCQYVSDLIEVTSKTLGISERVDMLNLLVMDSNGFKGRRQRPEKLLVEMLEENRRAGRDNQHPLLIRKINHIQRNPAPCSHCLNIDFTQIRSMISTELNSVSWFTIVLIACCYLEYEAFSFYSATCLFIVLKIAAYIVLYDDDLQESRHFTCSLNNLEEKRPWVLVLSSLAHKDINHLLCNISALCLNGPWLESMLGFKTTVLFFCLSSVASCIFSLKVHTLPSIGSSGVIHAIDGFLIRNIKFEWSVYLMEQILFYLATCDEEIDHAAHIGGFLFGYFMYDIWLKSFS